MLLDSLWNFCGASPGQTITASAVSTNIVDMGALGVPALSTNTPTRDLGKGEKIKILVQVTTTFATLTSLTVALQGSVDAPFTSPVALVTTAAVPVASLVAGYRFDPIDIIPRGFIYRFIRLNFTVGGSNATAGTVFASCSLGNQDGY